MARVSDISGTGTQVQPAPGAWPAGQVIVQQQIFNGLLATQVGKSESQSEFEPHTLVSQFGTAMTSPEIRVKRLKQKTTSNV
jgi:hypothetical protein